MWPRNTATSQRPHCSSTVGPTSMPAQTVDNAGVGGHTAIFHAVTQFDDGGLPVTQLLVKRGADLTVRAKLPGYYERPGEIVECTALGAAVWRRESEENGPLEI